MREAARGSRAKLQAFLDLLPRLRFLDPACGSGNFLLLAYRELRRLELDALAEQQKGQQVLDVAHLIRVNVGQFYGIEYDEFPAQIARVAMWLADHQANIEASRTLGQNFVNLPLTQAAHIRHGDALETDWTEHLELERDVGALSRVYIVGNPPFVGGKKMSAEQRAQVVREFAGVKDAGVLDYVAAWYVKAAKVMQAVSREFPDLQTATALVSTNSVTQGEQVAPLWGNVLNTYGQTITSAHRTFKWSNDAPGQAAVHCVIVQFQPAPATGQPRRLFTYTTPTAAPLEVQATNITPYLTDGPAVIVRKAQQPLRAGVPPIHFGNMPLDGGHLLLTEAEKAELLEKEASAAKFIRPLLDAQDYLNGATRYCLWLVDAQPAELAGLPEVRKRIEATKNWRLSSTREQTRKKADTPALFGENRHPEGNYLAVPSVSSERREYIPVGYLDSRTVVNNLLFMVPNADLFTFGVIQSRLHMDWMRAVSGRLESRYRYSKDLSYNTFPWPDRPSLKPAQVQAVEKAAQEVLEARQKYPTSTLAQMYDPNLMPADLRKAHNALDRALEALYGLKGGSTEAQRLTLLLTRYQELTPTLDSQTTRGKGRSRTGKA